MFRKPLARILIVLLMIASFSSTLIANPEEVKAFDYNNLASDGGFVNINGLTAQGIQALLVANGSFLKDFSENGRSAAQIIYDAAHGYNEASGTWNGIVIDTNTGTINPIAILATIQKEEGLVTGYYSQIEHYNQVRVDWAMGYGYTDDIIYQQYKGFTKQIEWGAWQLRYNYERAYGRGFPDYQVGQTQIFDDVAVTFSNRATASLYRYTPHLGTNFTYYFDLWSGNNPNPAYYASFVSQSAYPTVANGQTVTMNIAYRNTGSQTWQKGVVNLGLVDQNYNWLWGGYDLASGWITDNRPALLNEDSVAPGETGTFTFTIKNNSASAGNHRLDTGLVADGVTWFNQSTHAYWDVWVVSFYQASFVSQSAYPTVANGQTVTMNIAYRNTGSQTWQKGVVNLGLVNPDFTWSWGGYDLASGWITDNRPALLNEATVAPGEIGTFTFTVKNNNAAFGNHRLDTGLVADGITWFNQSTHAYWDVIVWPSYQASFVSQPDYPTVANGQTVTLNISFRNTGSQTWQKGVVNLGLVDQNYNWLWGGYGLAYNWISVNRPAILNEDTVAPGGIGTFTFTIKNNNASAGNYRLDTGLVADGITWFPLNTHAYWDVWVP